MFFVKNIFSMFYFLVISQFEGPSFGEYQEQKDSEVYGPQLPDSEDNMMDFGSVSSKLEDLRAEEAADAEGEDCEGVLVLLDEVSNGKKRIELDTDCDGEADQIIVVPDGGEPKPEPVPRPEPPLPPRDTGNNNSGDSSEPDNGGTAKEK